MAPRLGLLAALPPLILAACDTGGPGLLAFGGVTPGRPVASISVTPSTATLTAIGALQQFTAVALDSANLPVSGVSFSWSSGNTLVVTVDSTGLARAAGNGVAAVSAVSGSVTGSASVTVSAPTPVARPAPGHAATP